MVEALYILCAVTSLVCAALLGRAYARTRARLLMWSCLCFAGLAANNVLLFVDLVLFPERDLQLARNLATLAGLSLMLVGLIWDAE